MTLLPQHIQQILARRLARIFNMRPGEAPAVAAGLTLFFLLFTGYFMLRPVRETMGIAGGVKNLQWLFTATFVATLVLLPCFGWLASKVSRRTILPWTYGFFAVNLLLFAAAFTLNPNNLWTARVFYIWLSVFNLLAISLAWSVLADIFSAGQAKRLFALLAGGASLGGLTGPILGTLLVKPIGHAGLVLLSALFLFGSIGAAVWLHRWRDRHPSVADDVADESKADSRQRPLGGNPFAGAGEVFRSRYLLGIAFFVVLLSCVSTFLYFEQARLVAETFPDPTRQTEVFGTIDTVVQALAIVTQLFLTGHIARKLGIGILLTAVPLVMVAGFLWLAASPVFAVLVIVMIVRRAGEYALVRPGREMLYTIVRPEEKYKAKNFIDTVVYRGGDALSGWVKHALDSLKDLPGIAMLIGAALALIWAAVGLDLGRRQARAETGRQKEPESDNR